MRCVALEWTFVYFVATLLHMRRVLTCLIICIACYAHGKIYAPNDPNLYYSPFAWSVTSSAAATINSASYVRFLFSGSYLSFQFDVSRMVSPPSEVLSHCPQFFSPFSRGL